MDELQLDKREDTPSDDSNVMQPLGNFIIMCDEIPNFDVNANKFPAELKDFQSLCAIRKIINTSDTSIFIVKTTTQREELRKVAKSISPTIRLIQAKEDTLDNLTTKALSIVCSIKSRPKSNHSSSFSFPDAEELEWNKDSYCKKNDAHYQEPQLSLNKNIEWNDGCTVELQNQDIQITRNDHTIKGKLFLVNKSAYQYHPEKNGTYFGISRENVRIRGTKSNQVSELSKSVNYINIELNTTAIDKVCGIAFPQQSFTVVTGPNDVGKTSFLETIGNSIGYKSGYTPDKNWGSSDGVVLFIRADSKDDVTFCNQLNCLEDITPDFQDIFKEARNIIYVMFEKHLIRDIYTPHSQLQKLRFSEEMDQDNYFKEFATNAHQKFKSLPTLEQQGSGIQRATSIVLKCITYAKGFSINKIFHEYQHGVIIIDEPEMLLHSPQVRLLVRWLYLSPLFSNMQIVVATHSSDVISEVLTCHWLNSGGRTVLPLLLKYPNGKRYVCNLFEPIQKFKQFPTILTRIQIAPAFFHHHLVLVEGQSDRQVFKFVYDHMKLLLDLPLPDVEFMECHGKSNVITTHVALLACKLAPISILDFDCVLTGGSSTPLDMLIKRLSPTYASMAENIKIKWAAIKEASKGLSEETVSIDDIVSFFTEQKANENRMGFTADKLTEKCKEFIERRGNAERIRLKKTGLHTENLNDATKRSYKELFQALMTIRIHVNPYGELERFTGVSKGHFFEKMSERDFSQNITDAIKMLHQRRLFKQSMKQYISKVDQDPSIIWVHIRDIVFKHGLKDPAQIKKEIVEKLGALGASIADKTAREAQKGAEWIHKFEEHDGVWLLVKFMYRSLGKCS